MRYTLGKDEKLKSKKLIERLFKDGKRIQSFPLQLLYLKLDHLGEAPVKMAFSVPKKRIKLAVNRNRIKRQMREAYRKHKFCFFEVANQQHICMFIYLATNELEYAVLEEAVQHICKKFAKNILENEKY